MVGENPGRAGRSSQKRTGARVVEASANELQERVGREARARLGPERWAQAYAAGRKTSIDVLLKDIDRARA